MKLSRVEIGMLRLLYPKNAMKDLTIKRKSDKEFDLKIKREEDGIKYSEWLPLAVIKQVEWTKKKYAELSDYPEMVMGGDWSGIRDSKPEKIWQIFELAQIEFLEKKLIIK